MTRVIRTYRELVTFDNFYDRFEYLKLNGVVGAESFGFDRYLNQIFYGSPEWKKVRRFVIMRDSGCDLGDLDFEIADRIYIHHMNPIDRSDVINRTDFLLNPDYLVCASRITHQAIHYGDSDLLPKLVERTPGDTTLW